MKRTRSASARIGLPGAVAYVILIVVAAAILVPIVYAVLGGFKTNGQLCLLYTSPSPRDS